MEISGRPKLYRAIEPQKAIESLLVGKKNKYQLEQEALELKETLILGQNEDEAGEKVMKVKTNWILKEFWDKN